MTEQSEQEESNNNTQDSATPTKAESFRQKVSVKLKLIANYILDGFAPVAAVAALIVAAMAINSNHSSLAQLEGNATVIESLNASLLASKAELEKLKADQEQEKITREEASNKQNDQMEIFIRNVSQLQIKMKISPTLQEQLHQAASAAAVILPPASIAASAVAPASAGVAKNTEPQGKVLTKAIEKFNQKAH